MSDHDVLSSPDTPEPQCASAVAISANGPASYASGSTSDTADGCADQVMSNRYKAERLEILQRAIGRPQLQPSTSKPRQMEPDLVRRIQAHGLVRGQTPQQIAVDIYDQCGPLFGITPIKAHRLAHGVSLSDIVARVRALFEVDGKPVPKLGDTLLSAYESGYKRPGPEYLHYLCVVYQVEPDDLGYRSPCVCGRGHADHPDARPPAVRVGKDEEFLREALPQILDVVQSAHRDPSGSQQAFTVVDHLRLAMDDALDHNAVSLELLDQWEDTILGYCRTYQETSSLQLLYRTLLDYVEIRRLCEQRQAPPVYQRLCRVAAQLSGVAGILLTILGDQPRARSFFATAHTAAFGTGERGLRAWVLAREALVPLYYGDPAEALRLARQAQNLAGYQPSAAAAMAPAVQARALAQLAWRDLLTTPRPWGGLENCDKPQTAYRQAEQALAQGRRILDQLPDPSAQTLMLGFPKRQMLFYEGDVYTGFGAYLHGDQALARALELYSPTEVVDRTLVRLDQAACALHAGDPAQAAQMAQTAIVDLAPHHRTPLLIRRARQLADSVLRMHGDLDALTELDQMLNSTPINTLLSAPVPSAIRTTSG